MNLETIELLRLRLNPYNDRHGPLRDETASIQWLLENRALHMRALSQDLAKTKRLYERPLVRPDGEGFIVFDGNRRVCCVKLLDNPKLAPSEKWVEFYSELASDEVKNAFGPPYRPKLNQKRRPLSSPAIGTMRRLERWRLPFRPFQKNSYF